MGLVKNESLSACCSTLVGTVSDDFSLTNVKISAAIAGDGEDEEPACGRDDHEEEEKYGLNSVPLTHSLTVAHGQAILALTLTPMRHVRPWL